MEIRRAVMDYLLLVPIKDKTERDYWMDVLYKNNLL